MNQPSLRELVGDLKNRSDLRSTPVRLRYLDNQGTVGPGVGIKTTRHTFPRANYCDVSSLRFRGKITITSSDPNIKLASGDVSALLERVKVTLGNKEIYLQDRNDLVSTFSTNLEVTAPERDSFENYLRMYPSDETRASQESAAQTENFTIVGNLGHKGSFVNCQSIWPLKFFRTGLNVDLWWNDPAKCLYSPANDTNATYEISEFEIYYDSLESPSLDLYFSQNAISYHTHQCKHLINFIQAGSVQTTMRIPSNTSNASSVFHFIQPQSQVNDISIESLENNFIHASD